jgi:Ca2+/H+ antiporter
MRRLLPITAALAFSAVSLPSTVLAHPGHDHGHWSSAGLHAIAAVALIAAVITGVWFLARRHRSSLQQQRAQKNNVG